MLPAPDLPDDVQRCASLRSLGLLDTPAEERFDRITRLAQQLFDVPIVLLSLVDHDRQWFKSRQGLRAEETPRAVSFCGHAIAQRGLFLVEDAHQDPRFADNPLVTGEPHVRFYAGQPLNSPLGHRVGTLCLIDTRPRQFSGEQRSYLRDLALLVEAEFRRDPQRISDPTERRKQPRRVAGQRLDAAWRRLATRFGTRRSAALPALCCALAVLITEVIWERQQLAGYRGTLEREAVQRLSLHRGAIESALNAKLHFVHGLNGYVHAGGGLNQADFADFASDLAAGVKGVRSMQLAPGGVVSLVWPRVTNQAAIGHDLFADPARRTAAQAAIAARRLWLAGPLTLIQGGQALIGRFPIFHGEDDQAEQFWGFATVLIDLPTLWEEVKLLVQDGDFLVALRGRDAAGSQGEVFFGDASVFDGEPVAGRINLPAGSWDIAVLPKGGWPRTWPGEISFRVGAGVLASLVGLLVYFLLRLPASLQRAVAAATSALERNENQFLDAIEALPDGFVIYDSNNRLVVCNERFREMYAPCRPFLEAGQSYGMSMQHGLESGMLDGVDPADPTAVADALERLQLHNQVQMGSHERQFADGRTIRVVSRRMRDGGTVSFHMDVSQQKAGQHALIEARERAEAANRAKSAFLATVSHEVRTPLNGVLGLLSVLSADKSLQPEQSGYVNTAHDSARHLLEILNEILDLSKLEADRLELDVNHFILGQTLQDAAKLIEAQARSKGLSLELDIDADLDRQVVGDQGRLRQILLNLLSNAVKFTDQGRVSLKARGQIVDNAVTVRIEVSDTGIGFEPGEMDKLFEPFTQLDSDADRRFTGTGLGLAICRRLIELMHGSIRAHGAPGEGACFIVECSFPLAAPDSRGTVAAPLEADAPMTPRELGWPEIRVLLAEDSPTNQLVIQAMLKDSGYRTDSVHNGKEAIEALEKLPYDLVLMDVYMPEMDGITAAQRLRERSEFEALPIIALTANAMEGDSERFLQAGMDAYLPKPVSRSALLQTMYEQLSLRQASATQGHFGVTHEA